MSSHPTRAPGARLRDIFPSGFDERFGQGSSITSYSKGSRRPHFSCQPEQLLYSLIDRYDPQLPMESIVVKAAWYGKQTSSARHEFIVVQVEDLGIPGLVNYLILDRNVQPHTDPSKVVSSRPANANDTFKISYDGDLEKLIEDAQLTPYKYLEELLFPPSSRLHLYELVALANIVSRRYDEYNLLYSSCYLFAGLIWECMHQMCPSASYREALARNRGKCRWFRYTPSDSTRQETYIAMQDELSKIEKDIWGEKGVSCLTSRTANTC